MKEDISEGMTKELHHILKTGTTDSAKDWFAAGEYKRLPNEVGGRKTTLPENISKEIRGLSEWDCERGFLTDTYLTAQDRFKAELNFFHIPFNHEEA